eukprot:scaffold194847_cov30-Tisochrysis_lutea.AAC.2
MRSDPIAASCSKGNAHSRDARGGLSITPSAQKPTKVSSRGHQLSMHQVMVLASERRRDTSAMRRV